MNNGVFLGLSRQEILWRIQKENLIQDFIDLEVQLTPNGFDLTCGWVYEFDSAGAIDFSNRERLIPQGCQILPQKKSPEDKFGWWQLKQGIYKIKTNEIVNLPFDLIALAFSRSSLLRAGAFTQHGVWDAGFKGRGEFILAVENPFGLQLKQNARIAQLIFLPITKTNKGYQGMYQGRA